VWKNRDRNGNMGRENTEIRRHGYRKHGSTETETQRHKTMKHGNR
jgi:hypothetical protein